MLYFCHWLKLAALLLSLFNSGCLWTDIHARGYGTFRERLGAVHEADIHPRTRYKTLL